MAFAGGAAPPKAPAVPPKLLLFVLENAETLWPDFSPGDDVIQRARQCVDDAARGTGPRTTRGCAAVSSGHTACVRMGGAAQTHKLCNRSAIDRLPPFPVSVRISDLPCLQQGRTGAVAPAACVRAGAECGRLV